MKLLYLVTIIGLLLVGCARHEPTITLANESQEGHFAQLYINDLWLCAYPYDTDNETIHEGTYEATVLIYDPVIGITITVDEIVNISDNTTCIIFQDSQTPVSWQ